jgi:hypothetical protein
MQNGLREKEVGRKLRRTCSSEEPWMASCINCNTPIRDTKLQEHGRRLDDPVEVVGKTYGTLP